MQKGIIRENERVEENQGERKLEYRQKEGERDREEEE